MWPTAKAVGKKGYGDTSQAPVGATEMAHTYTNLHNSTHQKPVLAPIQKHGMELAFGVRREESFAPTGARKANQTVSLSYGFRRGPHSDGPGGPARGFKRGPAYTGSAGLRHLELPENAEMASRHLGRALLRKGHTSVTT
jgi:hypothetical protein